MGTGNVNSKREREPLDLFVYVRKRHDAYLITLIYGNKINTLTSSQKHCNACRVHGSFYKYKGVRSILTGSSIQDISRTGKQSKSRDIPQRCSDWYGYVVRVDIELLRVNYDH